MSLVNVDEGYNRVRYDESYMLQNTKVLYLKNSLCKPIVLSEWQNEWPLGLAEVLKDGIQRFQLF